MGITDFLRAGVKEMMIARSDANKRDIVFKHPETTIPKYAQLTVDADEAAVFFRDGALVGVLKTVGAGQRHTLDAQNIPFLSNLVDSFTGGNVFITDLYFVTTRTIRDTRFGGTLQPIKDPELEITVTPRIFGIITWKVTDPAKFIVEYLGMGGSPTNAEVESFITLKFMNAVKRVVPEFVIKRKIEVQALAAYHGELGDSFVQQCAELADIGVQFMGLGDFTLNFSDEEMLRIQAAQDRYADIKAKKRAKDDLGGGNYMQYAAAEAMMGAGQGMAKGGGEGGGMMSGGAGLGMGMAMAQNYAQAMQQGLQNPGSGGGGNAAVAPVPVPVAPAAAKGLIACPACSAQVAPGKFCAECGASLAPQPKVCPACSTESPAGSKFCLNCGTNIKSI